jgi:hypothetical protein
MSILEEEFGVERYSELLARYFKDNPGPQGPAGSSNTLIAKEARYKTLGPNTSYTGWTHTIQASELIGSDVVWIDFWYSPFQLVSISILLIWETLDGDQHFILGPDSLSGLADNHFALSIAQDAGNTSYLIASSHNSFTVGAGLITSWRTKILLPDGNPRYNWLSDGGSFKIQVTTGGAAGAFPGFWLRSYYYHMKS